jgi:hypothetical protein
MADRRRTPVYLLPTKSSSFPALPPHRTSPAFACLLVNASWAKYLDAQRPRLGIVLLRASSWAEVKEYFRGTTAARPVPKILPPRQPEPIVLSYPRMGQESDAKERQAALWMKATRF